MNKLLITLVLMIFILSLLPGCGTKSGNGELIGVTYRSKWFEPKPYGMVLIPRGSFDMGSNDQDVTWSLNSSTKTVSIEAFWMDETEITNNEYRQFINWVIDSIARQKLGQQFEEFVISEDDDGNPIEPPRINWDERFDWDDEEYVEILEEMYVPSNERFYQRKEIDTRKINYRYEWFDFRQAAKKTNRYNYETGEYDQLGDDNGERENIADRSSFIMKEVVNIYPDTLCWIHDYTYSYNEPLTKSYFWHPGYDSYPVVGISWKQAVAFCTWRTRFHNSALNKSGNPLILDYRLPTEPEWEYAARGGLRANMYPWGGPYTRNNKGCFLANFKPLRGNYIDDGGLVPLEVGSYEPNGFGLYDMAGNVAEWTSGVYDESAYNFIHDLNPTYEYNARPEDPPALKRKVVRGGSWKDIGWFLQCGTRSHEYQDTAKSSIGFRCARSYLGAR